MLMAQTGGLIKVEEDKHIIQKGPDDLEDWNNGSVVKFNKTKYKVMHLELIKGISARH